jgi:O-antigen ligase
MQARGITYILKTHTMLSLMILTIPFSGTAELGSNLFGITGLKPLNILAGSVFMLWLLKGGEVLTYRNRIRFRATMIYFAYLAIFSIAFFRSYFNLDILNARSSLAIDDFSGASFRYVLSSWVKPILLTGSFIYILNHIKDRDEVEAVVDLLLFSLFIFAIATLLVSMDVNFVGGSRRELSDVFGDVFGFHYNTVGTILMLSVPLALNRALYKGKAWIVIFLVIVLALLMTYSRGAIIGATVGILISLYFEKRVSVVTVAVISLLVLLDLFLAEPLQTLFSSGVESGDLSAITSGRIENIWIPLLQELSENPYRLIFGYGLYGIIITDSYVHALGFFQSGHAHNAYIDLLVDGGLIVFVPFMLLLISLLRQALIWRRSIKNATFNTLLSSVFVYLISAITERQFFPRIDNTMLFPILALLLVIVISENTKSRRINKYS